MAMPSDRLQERFPRFLMSELKIRLLIQNNQTLEPRRSPKPLSSRHNPIWAGASTVRSHRHTRLHTVHGIRGTRADDESRRR